MTHENSSAKNQTTIVYVFFTIISYTCDKLNKFSDETTFKTNLVNSKSTMTWHALLDTMLSPHCARETETYLVGGAFPAPLTRHELMWGIKQCVSEWL